MLQVAGMSLEIVVSEVSFELNGCYRQPKNFCGLKLRPPQAAEEFLRFKITAAAGGRRILVFKITAAAGGQGILAFKITSPEELFLRKIFWMCTCIDSGQTP